MLNVYNYYAQPKSLSSPSEHIVKEWKKERDEKMPKFQNDLWELQDDWEVNIGQNEKPNGDHWYTVRWGRDGRVTFYIPAESFVAREVDYAGKVIATYSDPDDIVNMLADELRLDGAYRQDDDDDFNFDDDEYEDD